MHKTEINENLLHSTGNSTQYSAVAEQEKNLKQNGCVCIYMDVDMDKHTATLLHIRLYMYIYIRSFLDSFPI